MIDRGDGPDTRRQPARQLRRPAAEIEDVRVGAASQLDEERIEAGGIRRARTVGLDDRGIAELLGVATLEPAWLRLRQMRPH